MWAGGSWQAFIFGAVTSIIPMKGFRAACSACKTLCGNHGLKHQRRKHNIYCNINVSYSNTASFRDNNTKLPTTTTSTLTANPYP